MTDEHLKGTLDKAHGTVEEGLGTLSGDRKQQARGKVRQVRRRKGKR